MLSIDYDDSDTSMPLDANHVDHNTDQDADGDSVDDEHFMAVDPPIQLHLRDSVSTCIIPPSLPLPLANDGRRVPKTRYVVRVCASFMLRY